jgi:hypothetical protein
MVTSILELPAELLISTLSLLPINSLLNFSQCSRYACSLANSSLHTLDLDFCSSSYSRETSIPTRRMFSIKSTIIHSDFGRKYSLASIFDSRQTNLDSNKTLLSIDDRSPYKIMVRIPEAHTYRFETLINFHAALLTSILTRHHHALHTLDVSLWTLSVPVAKAISQLYALRSLSIKLEGDSYQCTPIGVQQNAWQVLADCTAWNGRLCALKIQNVDIYISQLTTILTNNPQCQELQLSKCRSIGKALWEFLGEEWRGHRALQILAVADCGAILNKETLKAIEKLKGLKVRSSRSDFAHIAEHRLTSVLQYLDLRGCVGLDAETVNIWNNTVWHNLKLIPPDSFTRLEEGPLEVDSDCGSDDEV